MSNYFKKIGLALTFSPSGRKLIKIAARLNKHFNSQLILIHIGVKQSDEEVKIRSLIKDCGLHDSEYELINTQGNPAKVLLKIAKQETIDLLIAGALEKEKLFKYYFGSIARYLMRNSSCPLLIVSTHNINQLNFRKIFVTVDYTNQSERAIKMAAEFAEIENDSQLFLLRLIDAPGLNITGMELGSLINTDVARQRWYKEEKNKLDFYIKELHLNKLNIHKEILYGKENLQAAYFARENSADLIVLARQSHKINLLDRLLAQDLEIIFEKLPSNLLLIK